MTGKLPASSVDDAGLHLGVSATRRAPEVDDVGLDAKRAIEQATRRAARL